ncbi:MAG: hypothetical protein ACI9BF_000604 [Candidatus Paceibacteria bacterium]|jgi:hypothetical protein
MSIKKTVKKTVTKKVVKKTPTKKVTVKKTLKKTPVKKVIKKTPARKITTKRASSKKGLVYANDQTSFWLKNGQILNSLTALRDALNDMEKDVYSYHASGTRNDFANWVAVVLSDNKCAIDLEKAKTPTSAKTIVVRHLKFYTN